MQLTIPAFRKVKQDHQEFKASLGYVRPWRDGAGRRKRERGEILKMVSAEKFN